AASRSLCSTPTSVSRMRKPSALMKPRAASARDCASCARARRMRLSMSAIWARTRSSSMRKLASSRRTSSAPRLMEAPTRAGMAEAAGDERDLGAHAFELDAEARIVEAHQFCTPPYGSPDARGHGDDARRQLGGNARLLLRHHRGRRSKLGVYGDLGKWPWRPLRRA